MRRTLSAAGLAIAGFLLSVRGGSAADTPFPSHDVRVHASVGEDGRATVNEEYTLTAAIARTPFQFLSDPCAVVGPVSGAIGAREIEFATAAGSHTPWTFLDGDFGGAFDAAAGALKLRYEVHTRGAQVVVPLVMPATALALADGARGARVNITVAWTGADGAARVALPRLEPSTSPNEWQAELLAMPSSIRLDTAPVAGSSACARSSDGPTGGLEWRFVVFVGTMVIWVPTYLLWFARRWRATS
ncbi:MAG TPA: hypothetical protein VH497_05545 [Vicinamibacterales bacterium]